MQTSSSRGKIRHTLFLDAKMVRRMMLVTILIAFSLFYAVVYLSWSKWMIRLLSTRNWFFCLMVKRLCLSFFDQNRWLSFTVSFPFNSARDGMLNEFAKQCCKYIICSYFNVQTMQWIYHWFFLKTTPKLLRFINALVLGIQIN